MKREKKTHTPCYTLELILFVLLPRTSGESSSKREMKGLFITVSKHKSHFLVIHVSAGEEEGEPLPYDRNRCKGLQMEGSLQRSSCELAHLGLLSWNEMQLALLLLLLWGPLAGLLGLMLWDRLQGPSAARAGGATDAAAATTTPGVNDHLTRRSPTATR